MAADSSSEELEAGAESELSLLEKPKPESPGCVGTRWELMGVRMPAGLEAVSSADAVTLGQGSTSPSPWCPAPMPCLERPGLSVIISFPVGPQQCPVRRGVLAAAQRHLSLL